MTTSGYIILIVLLFSKCPAVVITRIKVPSIVEVGAHSVILDCEYRTDEKFPSSAGLVIKWFFNGSTHLVYQWIPPRRPQVVGLLKGKVDMEYRISDDPLQAYRAMKINYPTAALSGNYTCVVSTFLNEDRKTETMIIYSVGKNFHFMQDKKYVFLVTLVCIAEDLHPRPEMLILSDGQPLKHTEVDIRINSRGLYEVEAKAVLHDDEVARPWEEFLCLLTLPLTNYTVNRTTVYYPGLMPTASIRAIDGGKFQKRHGIAQNCGSCSTSFMYLVLHILTVTELITK